MLLEYKSAIACTAENGTDFSLVERVLAPSPTISRPRLEQPPGLILLSLKVLGFRRF
jgi:hypothetical protein